MKLVGINKLEEFKDKYGSSIKGLTPQIDSWIAMVKNANWKNHHDLRNQFPKASILTKNNVVFNILGSKYRIWVKINYEVCFVVVEKIGTHKEYNKWNIQ